MPIHDITKLAEVIRDIGLGAFAVLALVYVAYGKIKDDKRQSDSEGASRAQASDESANYRHEISEFGRRLLLVEHGQNKIEVHVASVDEKITSMKESIVDIKASVAELNKNFVLLLTKGKPA